MATVPGVGQVATYFRDALAPTLIHVGSTGYVMLAHADMNGLADVMYTQHSWSVASFDIPGHGANLHATETYGDVGSGMGNWVTRTAAGENIAETFKAQLSDLVAWLINEGHSAAGRIAVSGISRGGFLALHALAVTEVAAAVGLMPVTDLASLDEFAGHTNNWIVKHTRIGACFNSQKPAYIEIGNQDVRVGSWDAARNVAEILARLPMVNDVALTIAPDTAGHVVPAGAVSKAATWLSSKVQ